MLPSGRAYINFYIYVPGDIRVSTAVEQAVACAPVTQRALVRSPVGTSFLGEGFSEFFLTCNTNVRKLYLSLIE